jgi:NADH dehydrogenase
LILEKTVLDGVFLEHLASGRDESRPYKNPNVSHARDDASHKDKDGGMKVLVTGATGYVGHSVCEALVQAGHSVVGLSRDGQKSKAASGVTLALNPKVEYRAGDVASGTGLTDAMKGVEAVVHLVGIIAEKGEQTFDRVHVGGTRNVLEAAKAAGVKRHLQMSALGAGPQAASGYSSTKYQAEQLVQASTLEWTIFRPSLVFGKGDDFFGRVLKNLVSSGPIVPQIGDGSFPFRPVWVGDVAAAFVQALTTPATVGKVYDLVGPKEYTFKQLLDLEMDVLGMKKPMIPVPIFVMDVMVPLMSLVPSIAPITKDQYAMLKAGNTADPSPMKAAFTLEWRELEQMLPEVLGKSAPGSSQHANA